MSISLIIKKRQKNGDIIESSKEVHCFSSDCLCIGSEEESDLVLDLDPFFEKKNLIFRKNKTNCHYTLENMAKIPLHINGEKTTDSPIIQHGDNIRLVSYFIEFFVVFPQVSQRKMVKLAPLCSIILIALIFSLEISIAFFLPKYIGSRQDWGTELVRQRITELVDSLRVHGKRLPEENLFYTIVSKLLQNELDTMASYMKTNLPQMSIEDMSIFHDDLLYIAGIIEKLEDNTLSYPAPQSIDHKKYMKTVFKDANILLDGEQSAPYDQEMND